MTDGLLPGADRDLVERPREAHRRRSARRCCSTRRSSSIEGQRRTASRVTFEGELPEAGERADVRSRARLGRPPAELRDARARQDAGRRSNQRGFIEVDAQRRTAEPTIFAIGDVAGEPMLAHKASHEARVAVEAIAGERVAFEPRGDPGRRLHRSRARLVRPDRDRGAEAEARGRGRAVPVGRLGPRDHARPHRRPDQARHRSGDRARARRRHRRPRRRRADRRRRARHRDGRDRRRPQADASTRIRRCRRR